MPTEPQHMHPQRRKVYQYLLTKKATITEICKALDMEYQTATYHVRNLAKDGNIFKSKSLIDGSYIYTATIDKDFAGEIMLHKFQGEKLTFQEATTAYWVRESNLGDILSLTHGALCSLAVRARWPQQFNTSNSQELRHLTEFRKTLESLLELLDSLIKCGVASDPERFIATLGEVNWGYIVTAAQNYESHKGTVISKLRDFNQIEKHINTTYAPDPNVVEDEEEVS